MKPHTGLMIAGVLLSALALGACGKKDDPAATAPAAAGSTATASAGLKEGDNAPDITMTLQDEVDPGFRTRG